MFAKPDASKLHILFFLLLFPVGFSLCAVLLGFFQESKNGFLGLFLNLLFDLKSIKQNRYYWFAWLNYLAATLMFLVFYEKGFRMMHANFSWGYMHGMFFVFLMTLIVMVKNIREWWKSWKVIFVIGEIAVFFYHLVCGVNFLMYAVMGNDLAGF